MQNTFLIRWRVLWAAQVLIFCYGSVGNCDEATITVSGEAEMLVVPDEVVITAGIETRAQTVAAATEDNAAKISAILTFLKEAGIEDRNVRTEYISIEPIAREQTRYQSKGYAQQSKAPPASDNPFDDIGTEPKAEQPAGYLVSRQFAISITDLQKFEDIYQRLIELGINRVQGIAFKTSKLRRLRDQARLEAVRAAKEKAQAMAGELGARIASVKTIEEGRRSGGYGGYMQNSDSNPFGDPSGDTRPLAVGQIAITASVEIVFVLGNTELTD